MAFVRLKLSVSQSVTLCVGWTLLVCTPLCRTSCSKYTNRSSIFRPSFLLVEGRKAHMSCVSFSSWVNQPVSLIHPSIAEPFIRPPHIQRFHQTYIVLSIPPFDTSPHWSVFAHSDTNPSIVLQYFVLIMLVGGGENEIGQKAFKIKGLRNWWCSATPFVRSSKTRTSSLCVGYNASHESGEWWMEYSANRGEPEQEETRAAAKQTFKIFCRAFHHPQPAKDWDCECEQKRWTGFA